MYKFSVSINGFQEKPSHEEYRKMAYTTKELTLEEIKTHLEKGHTICCWFDFTKEFKFYGKGIKVNHFLGSYGICIDLDDQTIDIDEKIKEIKLKPTIAYHTFSHKNIKGKYRYRFIYIFKDLLDKGNYKILYDYICDINNLEYDKRARTPYQLMHGTNQPVYLYKDNIYSITDKETSNYICISDLYHNDTMMHEESDNGIISLEIKGGEAEEESPNINSLALLDTEFSYKEFIDDFKTQPYKTLVNKYMGVFRNIEHSPFPILGEDIDMIPLPNDYYEIKRVWKLNPVTRMHEKQFHNHQHRRIKLYNNLMIRRLIVPDLSLDELLYCLCYEMLYYIDNNDKQDYITKNDLIKIAVRAYNADISMFHYKKPRKTMVNEAYRIRNNKTKKQVRNEYNARKFKQTKESNYELIKEYYEQNLTTNELRDKIMVGTGVMLSVRTIKRWKKENGLTRRYNKRPYDNSVI